MEKNKKITPKKRFMVALSTPEALGWAGLLVFICGWFFILGILVGRGLVPVPGQKESFEEYVTRSKQFTSAGPAVPAEPRAPETTVAQASPQAPAPSKAAATDRAKAPTENVPPAPAPDKLLKTPAVEKQVTEAVARAPVAEKLAAGSGASKPVAAAPTKAPDQAKDKIFTIQVAALRESQAADSMLAKLKKQNYAPYLEKATLADNVVWYRLRCGAFVNHDEAAPVLERLRKDGYSPILVRR